MLFGFRGGARRGRVSRELSHYWKTGTFQHESQTSFLLRFTASLERKNRPWGQRRPPELRCSMRPLGGVRQLTLSGWAAVCHSKVSMQQPASTANPSRVGTAKEIEAGFDYTCFRVKRRGRKCRSLTCWVQPKLRERKLLTAEYRLFKPQPPNKIYEDAAEKIAKMCCNVKAACPSVSRFTWWH